MASLTNDMKFLRSYITANDEIQYDNLAETIVCLNFIHSNLKTQISEIRLDLHMTIGEVKEKIYRHCGTKPDYMQISLQSSKNGQVICHLNEDHRKLGYYPVQHGMFLYITDLDPFSFSRGGGLEDVSLVKKYVMSDEDYEKRKDTVRSYKKEQMAKDPNWKPPKLNGNQIQGSLNTSQTEKDVPGEESIIDMKVGDRCEVQPGGRRGSVAYLGEVDELNGGGYWVGVKFDEPVGKCDGCVKGKVYFKCETKFGGFIRPHNVTVGDFPEEDPFAESDDDEI